MKPALEQGVIKRRDDRANNRRGSARKSPAIEDERG
jgi:hypothetical protein